MSVPIDGHSYAVPKRLYRTEGSAVNAGEAAPEREIEITPEMIEAGLEFFYGVVPFCDRPASREETVAALKSAYSAMRSKSRS